MNDRIQVFKPDGTFVKEKVLLQEHPGRRLGLGHRLLEGSAAEVHLSGDGANEKVHILDRDTLEVLTSFGDGGRQPGEFYAVHSIATDSKGNIFTTETYRGQRVQKFVYKGLARSRSRIRASAEDSQEPPITCGVGGFAGRFRLPRVSGPLRPQCQDCWNRGMELPRIPQE